MMRARAVANPESSFDFVFLKDLGGAETFENVDNIQYRIVRADRSKNYLDSIVVESEYDEIRITSLPDLANHVFAKASGPRRVYEFHSSDVRIIQKEISELELSNVDDIRVPTQTLANVIRGLVPEASLSNITVFPNDVDSSIFYPPEMATTSIKASRTRLIWVGQYSQAKGYRDFVRILGLLGDSYTGEMYFSGAISQDATKDLLRELSAASVNDRVSLFTNVSQYELADRYREYNAQTIYVSTSLIESFGYGVYEALLCGLPVVAYSVPALREFSDQFNAQLRFADIGDAPEASELVRRLRTWA